MNTPQSTAASPDLRATLISGVRFFVLAALYIFALFFLIIAGFTAYGHYDTIEHWRPVQVRVQSTSVYSEWTRNTGSRFGRSTQVYGVEHRLERIDNHQIGTVHGDIATGSRYIAQKRVDNSLREMPPGSVFPARQHPSDPARMSLATGYDWKSFSDVAVSVLWGLGILALALGLGKLTSSFRRVRVPRASVFLLLVVPLLQACTLEKVTVAEPDDIVVAEIILRTGILKQIALLHHTLDAGAAGDTVPDADIQVTASGGRVMHFVRTSLTDCVTDRPAREQLGTCYATPATNTITIDPGAQYSLHIALPDGKVMTSTTRVPGDFHYVHPATLPTVVGTPTCTIPPLTPVELAWSSSPDAWVYLDETNLTGLRAAFANVGIEVPSDPLRLVGLSISAADTTIVFPGDFGIFDRGDEARGDLLVALQRGLPIATSARVMVAAGDRNYVNWARGENFNPSGQVRVPSIRGDGTGVFGSLHNRSLNIRVGEPTVNAPLCH